MIAERNKLLNGWLTLTMEWNSHWIEEWPDMGHFFSLCLWISSLSIIPSTQILQYRYHLFTVLKELFFNPYWLGLSEYLLQWNVFMVGLPQNYNKDSSTVLRCKKVLCTTFSAKRCWQHCHLKDLLGLGERNIFGMKLFPVNKILIFINHI